MKVRILTVVLFVSVLSVECVWAQREAPTARFANNQWAIDFTSPSIDYRETVANGVVADTETGRHYGWQTSFSLQQPWLFRRLYLSAILRQSQGTLTHGEANPTFNSSPTLGNTRDYDLRTGVGVGIGDHVQITPYLGGGRHYWQREPDTPNGGGYLEHYQHDYAGGGILAQFSPERHLVFSGYGFLGVTFNSQLAAEYVPQSIICYAFIGCFRTPSSFNFNLGPEPMSMAGVSADIALGSRWHANVGGDWNTFRYGHSASQFGLMEPNSRTQNITAKAGIGYAF